MEDLQTSETVSMPRIILELIVVDEHAVFTLITDVVPTKLPIHRGRQSVE